MPGPIPLTSLSTDRLLIRPVRVSDAREMHDAMKQSFHVLKCWMPWAKSLASLGDVERYLANGVRLWQAAPQEGVEQPLQIWDLTQTYYYGATGIKYLNALIPSFEIGYWVNQVYAGQGFITEAMNALTRYLFDVLKAKRVEITCEEHNERSAQVAMRLGFQKEALLRNHRLDANSHICHTLIFVRLNGTGLPPLHYDYQSR